MTTSILDMIIDRVDRKNHVIGRVTRRSAFAEKVNFRVVHVIVQNQFEQILIQKIASGLRHEGAWGSSVAGYVKAGETYRQAAVRKLKEEIGLNIVKVRSHGTTPMRDEGCRKFIGVYSVHYDGPLKLVPEHAAGIEFLSMTDVIAQQTTGNRDFTPTFIHVMRYLHPNVFE